MKKQIFILALPLTAILFLSLTANEAYAASTKGKRGLLALASEAPDFHLPDVVSGKIVSKDDGAGKKLLLVIMLCRHCPYVQNVKQGIARLAKDYAGKDLGIVGVSANDPEAVPLDAPESLKEMALEEGFSFPILYDESQAVAQAYTAVATPDFFLFDRHRRLVYRGQFDASRPGNRKPVTGQDLRAAIDLALEGRPVPKNQKPSFGCSIKWKPGNEPSYF
jgi:peroxiredoxin